MEIVIPIALFLFLLVSITVVGYRYYARPGRYYEQIGTFRASSTPPFDEGATARKSGAVIKVIQTLGEKVPISPEEASMNQRLLIAAGYRSDNALAVYYGIRILVFVFVVGLGLWLRTLAPTYTLSIVVLLGSAVIAFFLPGLVLDRLVTRRQEILKFALPDALDLLVVCVEAGLGLDQALVKVSDELEISHPEISKEFELVSLEMQAGTRRADALKHLASRTGEAEIRKLVSILIQTDRFGTSMAESLRTHADFMRIKRRQEAEERANKVGVKLVFPIFFCILPAMLIVVGGPGILQILKELFPMMRQFKEIYG
jgi:tight adherence protein C